MALPWSSRVGPFRTLKNSNYRKYFGGQIISMTGTWIQSVAQSLLVYKLTGSAAWLGIIAFCSSMPAFLVSPLAGAVADAADRRRVLIIVQIVEMLQAFLLAALVFTNTVQIWHIVVLSSLLGVAAAFETTTRHAFSIDMVGKEDLTNAIALNSILVNLSRIFGQTVAGVTVRALGTMICFFLNGLSYLPVIWGLAAMRLAPHEGRQGRRNLIDEIVEGARYARRNTLIFKILILSTIVCTVACPFMALIPVFAFKALHGDEATVGWLGGMQGVGAVTAAFLFNAGSDLQAVRRKLIADIIFWGLGLITLGLSRDLWLSLGAMFTLGYFMMSVFPTMNNAVQQLVDDRMRGRVMSLYTMTFLGSVPIGSLLIGEFAERYTAPHAVTAAGLLTLSIGLALVVRSAIRDGRKMRRAQDASGAVLR